MAKENDNHPIQLQGLMQSVPIFEGLNKQNVNDVFDILDNIAKIGGWSEERKVRIARCRMTETAAKFVLSETAKSVLDYVEIKNIVTNRFDYIHPTTQL